MFKPPSLANVISGAWAFGGLCVGFLLANFGGIEFEGKLSVGNVFQSLVTVITAVTVAVYFRSLVDSKRKEKELMFTQLDLLQDCILGFSRLTNTETHSRVTSAVKRINVQSNFINKLATENGLAAIVFNLSEDIKKLRDLATETPKFTDPDYNGVIIVADNNITWDESHRQEIDIQIEFIRRKVVEAAFAVNRA